MTLWRRIAMRLKRDQHFSAEVEAARAAVAASRARARADRAQARRETAEAAEVTEALARHNEANHYNTWINRLVEGR
jgi:hypothetical protein